MRLFSFRIFTPEDNLVIRFHIIIGKHHKIAILNSHTGIASYTHARVRGKVIYHLIGDYFSSVFGFGKEELNFIIDVDTEVTQIACLSTRPASSSWYLGSTFVVFKPSTFVKCYTRLEEISSVEIDAIFAIRGTFTEQSDGFV